MEAYNYSKAQSVVIFQLIYTCAFTQVMSCDDLEIIAQSSRKRNFEFGITGVLLCNEGSALQILEGDKTAVMKLYKTIVKDARVSNILVLINRMATEREFPHWSMGFKNAVESEAVFKLCARSFPDALPLNNRPEVDTFGRTFARVIGLT